MDFFIVFVTIALTLAAVFVSVIHIAMFDSAGQDCVCRILLIHFRQELGRSKETLRLMMTRTIPSWRSTGNMMIHIQGTTQTVSRPSWQ